MFDSLLGKRSYKNISSKKAKELLSSGRKIVLIDVRTPEEYNKIHIPNSISLPLNQLKYDIENIVGDKGTEIIVYCLSGVRAASACGTLTSMGYTNVSNMGGIRTWKYKLERGRG